MGNAGIRLATRALAFAAVGAIAVAIVAHAWNAQAIAELAGEVAFFSTFASAISSCCEALSFPSRR